MQLNGNATFLVLIDLQKGVLARAVARSAWEHSYQLVICEDLPISALRCTLPASNTSSRARRAS